VAVVRPARQTRDAPADVGGEQKQRVELQSGGANATFEQKLLHLPKKKKATHCTLCTPTHATRQTRSCVHMQ
jgi:hypothetical protein